MEKYAKLLKLLDETENYEAASLVEEMILKKAQFQGLANVLKWKYLNRELKQKFKNLRELMATQVNILGPAAQKAVNQIGYWLKYVDEIQADPIDENPRKTQLDDETIANGTKWWDTVLPVIQPVESQIYGPQGEKLEDRYKDTYKQVKTDITRVLDSMNAVTPLARNEFAKYFA